MKFIKISTLRSFVDLNAAICRGASCSLPLARRDAHSISLALSLALSRFRSSCVRLFKVCVRSAFVYTQPRYSYAATPQAPAYRALLPQASGRRQQAGGSRQRLISQIVDCSRAEISRYRYRWLHRASCANAQRFLVRIAQNTACQCHQLHLWLRTRHALL